jgi:hypothetical protein
MKRFFAFVTILVWFAAASSSNERDAYTLYRSSVTAPTARVRVAIFDTANGKDYNTQKCRAAQDLYQKQDTAARFWCEQGSFGKQ